MGRMVDGLLSFWRLREQGGCKTAGVPVPAAAVHVISTPNIGLFDRIANPVGPNRESNSKEINVVISMPYEDS
jgi:hypothetical protein